MISWRLIVNLWSTAMQHVGPRLRPGKSTTAAGPGRHRLSDYPADEAATYEVFRTLGLMEPADRRRFRGLAELGRLGTPPKAFRYDLGITRNNTGKEKENAELESAS